MSAPSNVISLDRHRLTGVVSQVAELRAKLSLDPCQFWALIDTLPVAVMIAADRQCSLIEGNTAARLLLRCPPGQNLSRSAPERELPPFEVCVNGEPIPAHELPMQKAAANGKPAPRSECELRFADGSVAIITGHSVPIFGGSGEVCGSIGAFVDITHERNLEEQNRRLSYELELKANREALLLEIVRLIVSNGEGKAALTRRVFEKIGPLLDADLCFDYRFDPALGRLSLISSPGLPAELRPDFETVGLGEAYCGIVALTSKPFAADASLIASDPRAALVRKAGARAYACHPLLDSAGRLLGTLSFASTRRTSFTSDEIGFLQTLCQYVALSWENYRVRAEAAEGERQLRTVTDTAAVFIAHCDLKGRYKFVNRAYAERFGKTPEDLIGKTIPEVVGEKAYAAFASYVKRCLAGETLDFEIEIPYPTKGSRFMRCYYVPDKRDGRIEGLVAAIIDVTDRRIADEAVKRSEERLRFIADRAQIGHWHWDIEADHLEWSPFCKQLFGISPDQPMNYERFLAALHPDDRERTDRAVRACLESGGQRDYDIEYRTRPNGAVRWIHARGDAVFADGKPVRMAGIALDITERKAAEDQLARSEAQLRLAQRIGGFGSYDWDLGSNTATYSPEYLTLHGLPSGTASETFEEWQRRVYPKDRERAARFALQVLEPNPSPAVEYRIVRPSDGKARWIAERREVFHDRDGKPVRVVGSQQDITERREAEKALKASEERFRRTFENAAVGIAHVATDGRWLRVNNRLCEIVGYTPEELLQLTFQDITHPDDLKTDLSLFRPMLAGEIEHYKMDKRYRRKDGSLVWVRLTVGCARKRNQSVDYVISVIEDISDQKEAEFALRQSEERFRSLTDAIPQLVWTCTPDGFCNYVNEQWLTYTGAKPEDHLGHRWVEIIYPEDRSSLMTAWNAALAGSTPFDAEARLRASDGSYRWFKKRAHPLFGENGAVLQWFGSSTDVQAIVEAREVLARSREELEWLVEKRTRELRATQEQLAHTQRMDALGQLAGGIAHDFNNVLQAIEGGLGMIIRRMHDPGSIKHLSDLMRKSTERGAAITRRLLTFSRQADLHAKAFDPVEVLEELREILLHSLGSGVIVKVEAPDCLPAVVADKGQLETVLVNLATNARDAMKGQGELTLAVTPETCIETRDLSHSSQLKAGTYICFRVSDSGAGMTPDVLAKATEPFFTTKGTGQGTGLGLAMARGFAEQSAGGLQIESIVGRGTTVSLWLPVADAAFAAKDASPTAQSTRHAARILLVDDEPLVLQSLADQLEKAGYQVLPFQNGSEALASLNDGTRVDLIITDLSMPGMDGLSFSRQAQKRLSKTPTILLTGFASLDATLLESPALEGPFRLLQKPVAEDALLAEVAQAFDCNSPDKG